MTLYPPCHLIVLSVLVFASHLILITSSIKQYVVKKLSTCQFYPDITIFLVILRQYRYIGSLGITIPRYNDLISLLPWHIVYKRMLRKHRKFGSLKIPREKTFLELYPDVYYLVI